MHRTLKEQGLICMSVNLDDASDAAEMRRAEAYLKSQAAEFEHYVLNEDIEAWQKLLGTHGPPAVYVFGRDGKLAKAFKAIRSDDNPDAEVKYKTIEPFVKEQLKKK